MSLPTSYMTGNFTKIPQYFETILNAQAPEKFTVKFLKDLGFTSSTDIQFINVLKALGFLDESGTPTEQYYQLFDRSNCKSLVAQRIKLAYNDVFALNINANTMSREELKGKFKTLTAGQKGDSALNQMVSTFINLCAYADWSESPKRETPIISKDDDVVDVSTVSNDVTQSMQSSTKGLDLNYNIHIHLPATRDQAVYDALFASLAKHIPLK